jgi:hypothetical protein
MNFLKKSPATFIVLAVILAIITFALLIKVGQSIVGSGYIAAGVFLFVGAALPLFFIIWQVPKRNKDDIYKQVNILFAVLAMCVSILALATTHYSVELAKQALIDTDKSLELTQKMLNLTEAQVNRIARIDAYPIQDFYTKGAIGFWVENTGFRTVILEDSCLLKVTCNDGYTDNKGFASLQKVRRGGTEEPYAGRAILQVGDLAFFNSESIEISSNNICGKDCNLECEFRTVITSDVNFVAKIPIR